MKKKVKAEWRPTDKSHSRTTMIEAYYGRALCHRKTEKEERKKKKKGLKGARQATRSRRKKPKDAGRK